MALTYAQLGAFGDKYIDAKVKNNIFDGTAFLAWLNAKGKVKKIDGGTTITRSINYVVGSNDQEFSGSETLTAVEDDVFTAAEYQWKQLKTAMKIAKLDINKNAGKAGKINLVIERSNLLKKNMSELISTNIFGAGGTGTGSAKKFDGLPLHLSISTTLGGIAVADLALWIANVDENSGTNRPISLPLMQATFGGCTFDNESPEVIIAKQTLWDSVWGLYQPYQRLGNEFMGKLGFQSLDFNGVPIIVDNHISDANHLMFIGSGYRMDAMISDYMNATSFSDLEASDCIMKRMTLTANMTNDSRRTMGLLADVE